MRVVHSELPGRCPGIRGHNTYFLRPRRAGRKKISIVSPEKHMGVSLTTNVLFGKNKDDSNRLLRVARILANGVVNIL